ncbi:class A beta-lactamase [Caldimonas sp. KR1-144]|uniref:class A beta-lactamase n=1 Tax=Caldimonas sp. KR1-144 TaxID=3400911 RepID=UPI003C0F1B61
MNRRQFGGTLAALAAPWPWAWAQNSLANPAEDWAAIERRAEARLGVAVLDTATGALDGHRLDERFAMCSTFKWLAAALVLRRVDQGQERLDRRVRVQRSDLLSYSPVTEKRVGGAGMTVAELCEAAVAASDNAAANLLLASFGGPAALTRFARTLGDDKTRLDRIEPALNESRPGDERDTTTPRAMAHSLRTAALGDALSGASRAQLVRWLQATVTGTERLRAGLPDDWRIGHKTGTGERGSTNDVAVLWPPRRAPIVVAAYLTDSEAPFARREAALAAVARSVVARLA